MERYSQIALIGPKKSRYSGLSCTLSDAEIRAQVRLIDIPLNEVLAVYTCHQHRVKRVAVEPGNHNTWVTASEDGTVRQFDRRVRGMCEWMAVGRGLGSCAAAVLL
jgi:hypothetical protein